MKYPETPPGPVIISWSGLKRWENCPQHQVRVIRGEREKSNKGRIFLPGTVCDLVQRRWLESDDPQPGEMVQMVEDIFNETVAKSEAKIIWKGNPITDQNDVKALCREAVTRLEPWLMENVLPHGYKAEHKFKAHTTIPYVCGDNVPAPLTIIGGIDVLVQNQESGKFGLHDLKITKDPAYIRSTLAQLILYDLAWCIIQGEWDVANRWSFVTPMLEEREIPITVTQEDRQLMLSRIVKYAQGVWADEWKPKADDVGCDWCEAKQWCDKFKVVPILEENGSQRLSFAQAAAQRSQFRT